MRDIRLMLAFPSRDEVSTRFMVSFLNMYVALLAKKPPEGADYHISKLGMTNHSGSTLSTQRQGMMQEAIDGGYTHLLFIDTDQTCDENLPHYWLMHDYPVIAANISTKKLPAWPTARLKSPPNPSRRYAPEYGIALYTTKDKADRKIFQQVWRIGTGIMLIRLADVKKLKKPWFPVKWNPKTEQYIGEDWCFCERLEKAGIPIMVDHHMSYTVGHWGDHNFDNATLEMQERIKSLRSGDAPNGNEPAR